MARQPPFAAVWFDCDSTLATIEGVDELTRQLPPAEQARLLDLTRRAMEGTLALEEVYGSRLRQLAPSREQLQRIGRLYVEHTVPDAALVISALRHLDKQVGIASGGLEIPVRALAEQLHVPQANVHAVAVRFHADGTYASFDRASPLSRNRGKVAVLQGLPPSHRPLCFVGDGATDLETKGTVDLFVGFGGVEVRPAVKAQAEAWFATPSLAPLLQFVLTEGERQRLRSEPRFTALMERASASS